ncbi:hypothetical protein PF005_g3865 [Phytophthora fragariae]|uniref:Uncharacterized protein n=1 Tax=Phytophthora fragariae TaxID=53985 RepID=A0A6A3UQH3_9STRA|nr:hypothetical protein PF003_g22008 [Phytophthora fragariae]KAE8946105.1 hypothetical protein PF009_g4243 [Phytophthora fragariae]KAE9131093.1 hypothetical protein PF010_g3622 [Phytophthora fragariae]KAE9132205.1 hypothetical protein PF007_g3810 [Phytophthora fragariae]KAE9152564.1 hypothetical protein PF006_g3223 [Phytophthora fragariae]
MRDMEVVEMTLATIPAMCGRFSGEMSGSKFSTLLLAGQERS